MKRSALYATLLAIAACGSQAKPSTEPASPGATVAWADMNDDQRHEFMKTTVLPHMKEKFVAFDGTGFADMDCKTCHGPGVEQQVFEMPNPELMKLDFAHMDQLSVDEQATAKFMHEVVVPEMAALLGEAPYDPATQKGFGCLECHTTVDSK